MTEKINAADAMIKVLEDWGIHNIYGLPGGSFDSTIVAEHFCSEKELLSGNTVPFREEYPRRAEPHHPQRTALGMLEKKGRPEAAFSQGDHRKNEGDQNRPNNATRTKFISA